MGHHRYEFRVFFGDCDEAGIVFYPRYFTWFDNTFGDWCRENGLSQRAMRAQLGIFGTPIVSAAADFRGPATYDDKLAIDASVTKWTEKSFRVDYRALRGETLIAEGHEVRVCVARDAAGRFQSVAVPLGLREAFS